MSWQQDNHRALVGVVEQLGLALQRLAREQGAYDPTPRGRPWIEAGAALEPPAAFLQLAETFGLEPFELDVLLLCAGVELDANLARLCADVSRHPSGAPTFSLAMRLLPEPTWSALAPDRPLRGWDLITVDAAAGSLVQAPLRIDERVLHALCGVGTHDEQLRGLVEPVEVLPDLAPSQLALAGQAVEAWHGALAAEPSTVLDLCGRRRDEVLAVATHAAALSALPAFRCDAASLPVDPAAVERLQRRWRRETRLGPAVLIVDAHEVEPPGPSGHALRRLLARGDFLVVLCTRAPQELSARPIVRFDVGGPTRDEQTSAWAAGLGGERFVAAGELLASQFDMELRSIRAVAASVRPRPEATPEEVADEARARCRARLAMDLGGLAERIEVRRTWSDLTLRIDAQETLRDIAKHVRWRRRVLDEWGFAAREPRGLGGTSLFAGPSGTGKTLAAEVLASDLGLDLYRIDLSAVVSKFIGETEKHLARIFDAGERMGAMLLFDEADALFGRRSEVRDSHDRYANIEVSYLLQRIETYRGLAILTTNMRSAIDVAFLRRFLFVVDFTVPDAAARRDIWARVLPPTVPTEQLDLSRLAQLDVTGGQIHSIALSAAYQAADAGQPVSMAHVLRAARREAQKSRRPLTSRELDGWA